MIFPDLGGYCFMQIKAEALTRFPKLYKKLQNEKGITIATIRSNYGDEFENHAFVSFYKENGIDH